MTKSRKRSDLELVAEAGVTLLVPLDEGLHNALPRDGRQVRRPARVVCPRREGVHAYRSERQGMRLTWIL